MAEFMRKDIDPLEKLVYFKTRLYCTENEEALGNKSTASIQLEILLDCLDIIERISISGNDNNLSEYEKNYNLEDLIHMIPNKERKGSFSEKLILRLIYLIKDECTSLRLKGPILNFEEEFSIENYDKLMYNDRTLKRIFDELVVDLNENKIYLFNEFFNKCYEVFTKNILFNYKVKFRESITKYHFDNLKIIVELVGSKFGFNSLGNTIDCKSV